MQVGQMVSFVVCLQDMKEDGAVVLEAVLKNGWVRSRGCCLGDLSERWCGVSAGP